MADKIMDGILLDDTVYRLEGCCALIRVLQESAEMNVTPAEVIGGIHDLLECIVRDFRMDVDAARDYSEGSTREEAAQSGRAMTRKEATELFMAYNELVDEAAFDLPGHGKRFYGWYDSLPDETARELAAHMDLCFYRGCYIGGKTELGEGVELRDCFRRPTAGSVSGEEVGGEP